MGLEVNIGGQLQNDLTSLGPPLGNESMKDELTRWGVLLCFQSNFRIHIMCTMVLNAALAREAESCKHFQMLGDKRCEYATMHKCGTNALK
jgi:hypothetical protein